MQAVVTRAAVTVRLALPVRRDSVMLSLPLAAAVEDYLLQLLVGVTLVSAWLSIQSGASQWLSCGTPLPMFVLDTAVLLKAFFLSWVLG